MLTVSGGAVIAAEGVVADGHVAVDGGRIASVGARTGGGPVDIDARGGWIAPGFIDVQINGAHGIDVTTQPERIDELGNVLVRYGEHVITVGTNAVTPYRVSSRRARRCARAAS